MINKTGLLSYILVLSAITAIVPLSAVASQRCADQMGGAESIGTTLELGRGFKVQYQDGKSSGFIAVVDAKTGKETHRIIVPAAEGIIAHGISDVQKVSQDVISLRFQTKDTAPGGRTRVEYQLFKIESNGKISALTKFEASKFGAIRRFDVLNDSVVLVSYDKMTDYKTTGEYRSVNSYELVSINADGSKKVVKTYEDVPSMYQFRDVKAGTDIALLKSHNDKADSSEILTLNIKTGQTKSILKATPKIHPLRPALPAHTVHLNQITDSLYVRSLDLGKISSTYYNIELFRISDVGAVTKLADIAYNTRPAGIEQRPNRTIKKLGEESMVVVDDFSQISGDEHLSAHLRTIHRDLQLTVVLAGDKGVRTQTLLHKSAMNMGKKDASHLIVVVKNENEIQLQGKSEKDAVTYVRQANGTFKEVK